MKARYRHLLDHSIGCALSAIEIYNKPDFKEREQVFTILLVVAWESLLKARILKLNRNRLTSLYVRSGARYRRNRNGDYVTIGVMGAARECGLDPVATENLERIVELRDAAVHLTAESPALPLLVYSLGIACVRNYAKVAANWFDLRFDDYNFFILPAGFSYPFEAISAAQIRREPKTVATILRRVTKAQEAGREESAGYHLVFEIRTKLVSAKRLTGAADIVAAVDGASDQAIVVERRVRLIDQYPLRFTDLWNEVRAQLPGVKQNQVHEVLRDFGMRGDPRYSAYNYRSKAEEARGPSAATPVVYNHDAKQLLVSELRRRYPVLSRFVQADEVVNGTNLRETT